MLMAQDEATGRLRNTGKNKEVRETNIVSAHLVLSEASGCPEEGMTKLSPLCTKYFSHRDHNSCSYTILTEETSSHKVVFSVTSTPGKKDTLDISSPDIAHGSHMCT